MPEPIELVALDAVAVIVDVPAVALTADVTVSVEVPDAPAASERLPLE